MVDATSQASTELVQHMLTTVDNPFDPFVQYDEWLGYDESMEYYTNSLLARIVISSDEISYADQNVAREAAIDEIITENVLGLYRKVLPQKVLSQKVEN